jgi:hypothetical protein
MFLRVDHVHVPRDPATLVPPREVLVPSTRDSQNNNQNSKNGSIYMPYCVDKGLLIVCEPTSKSCPRDPSSCPITAPKTNFFVQSKLNIQVSSIIVFLA